jgi:hypothetical protein
MTHVLSLRSRHPLRRFALAAVSSLFFVGAAGATDAWVNPQTGSDPGVLGDVTHPFKTLHAAIDALRFASLTGVVRAMPGTYSDAPGYNDEQFPLRLQPGISLQGVGAKECVLRRTVAADPARIDESETVVLPRLPFTGAREQVYPIISTSQVLNSGPDVFIEGFTFQGGQIQIVSWAEDEQYVRIDNCVFDLRTGGAEDLHGPDFGILLVPIWDVHTIPPSYPVLRYNILNNTFIQGFRWGASPGDRDTCTPRCVALCNSNDPALWAPGKDLPLQIRGVSPLSVQNNVFRSLPNGNGTAMLGIDYADARVAFGTRLDNTNAFDPADVGGTSKDSSWRSDTPLFGPAQPVIVIDKDTAPRIDPGFVGEMISQTQTGLAHLPVRDWRLLPNSPLKDLGSSPLLDPSTNKLTLRAVSGTEHLETQLSPDGAFDWDGEGHGGPRIVPATGGEVDLGFDEIDELIIAGCYGNDSKSHGKPFDPSIAPGNFDRTYITRRAATLTLYSTSVLMVSGTAWAISPGTTNGLPAGGGTLYLDPSLMLTTALGAIPSFNWTNPIDSAVHTFGQFKASYDDTALPNPLHFNEQVLVQDALGTRLSNLQFEIF